MDCRGYTHWGLEPDCQAQTLRMDFPGYMCPPSGASRSLSLVKFLPAISRHLPLIRCQLIHVSLKLLDFLWSHGADWIFDANDLTALDVSETPVDQLFGLGSQGFLPCQ